MKNTMILIAFLLNFAMILTILSSCGSGTNDVANSSDNISSGNKNLNSILNSEITGEITISCYQGGTDGFIARLLEDAAKIFQREHPGTKVTVETFTKTSYATWFFGNSDGHSLTMEEEAKLKSDYKAKVSTEVLSGKGADIYAFDMLPFHKFASAGYLENLTEYMEVDSDFDMSKYPKNIFDALTYEEGMFIMPLEYNFNIFIYDQTLFDKNEQNILDALETASYYDVIRLGKKAFENQPEEEHNFMFNRNDAIDGINNMFDDLFDLEYANFADVRAKKANFADGRFAEFLNNVRGYSDLGYIKHIAKDYDSNILTYADIKRIRRERRDNEYEYYFFYQFMGTSILGVLDKNTGKNSDSPRPDKFDNFRFSGILSDSFAKTPFQCDKLLGINSNTENKKTAWEFIKFLLSYDMQTHRQIALIPINRDAIPQNTKRNILNSKYMGELTKGIFKMDGTLYPNAELDDEESQRVFDLYTDLISKYSERINSYVIHDDRITELVKTEVKDFFNGKRTAEETARILQNKVSLYLSE